MDYARAVVPLDSEKGEGILGAMYGVKAVEVFRDLEEAGTKYAEVAATHFDLDGAAANMRLAAGRLEHVLLKLAPDDEMLPLFCGWHCGNHRNNLTGAAVVEASYDKVWTYLYATSLFVHMGGNFLRLVQSTVDCAARFLPPPEAAEVGDAPNDALDEEMNDQVDDYLTRNHGQFNVFAFFWSSGDGDDRRSRRRRNRRVKKRPARMPYIEQKKLRSAFANLRRYFNTGRIWCSHLRDGRHVCVIPAGCNGYDSMVARRKAVTALVQLVYAAMPVRPTKGKWLKFGQSLDWHMRSKIMMLFNTCANVAFRSARHKMSGSGRAEESGNDPAMLMEFCWGAVEGV